MQRNIKLVKYKKYNDDFLLLEYLNNPIFRSINKEIIEKVYNNNIQKSFLEKLQNTDEKIKNIYFSVEDYMLSLGDDITKNQLKLYVAFKKVKNLACVEVYQQKILIYLKINPETVNIEKGFTRDVKNIGHYGTGDLEITIKDENDFKKATKLFDMAYELE